MIGRFQLQPLVLPQPSQTKQLPAGRILVPQLMHSGESADEPSNVSNSSVELCTDAGAGSAAATPSTFGAAGVIGADCAND